MADKKTDYTFPPPLLEDHELDHDVWHPANETTSDEATTMPDVATLPAKSGNAIAIKALQNGVSRASSSTASLALRPAFNPKSSPADPHTTHEDANLTLLRDDYSNALASVDADRMASPGPASAGSDLRSSLLKIQDDDSEVLKKTFSDLAASPTFKNPDSDKDAGGSPKVIAYRKTNHRRTVSDRYETVLTPLFDPKLYVDEKFKDTEYRYATMRRNVDFHQIFRSLDLTDRLLDDFACALSREILLQGRVYITEHLLCFNSNLLGWVTSVVVPFEDIVRFEKKLTAGLFPNGILVETRDGRHNFASFLSRDATFDFMVAVWLASTGRIHDSGLGDPDTDSKSSDNEETEASKISSYILSIDGDDDHWNSLPLDLDLSDTEEENGSEWDERSASGEQVASESSEDPKPEFPGTSLRRVSAVASKIRAFKEESKYRNMGPDIHAPTAAPGDFEDAENETEILTETFDAPLGMVFDVMFGSNDTSFQRRFLEDHDASEISPFSAFHPMEDNPTKLQRNYTYLRALGYLIGPKLTHCIVSEEIEHLNFADHVVVLNVTSTPDVPSGGSFTVRTRYYFTWGPLNTTTVKIAFYVKWTGRLWVKSVIEKSTKSAQATVAKDLVDAVRGELDSHTTFVLGPISIEQPELESMPEVAAKQKRKKPKTKLLPAASNPPNVLLWVVILLVIPILLVLVYIALTLRNLQRMSVMQAAALQKLLEQ